MLKRIVIREVLDHVIGLRFAIACGLCLLVVLASLYVRAQDFRARQDDHAQEAAIAWKQAQGVHHPRWHLYRGIEAHQPPNPLAIYVRGISDSNGLVLRVNGGREPEHRPASVDNPLGVLSPDMDMIFFVGVIMSLLAVVFGYDAIAGEKERGTLRLMLTYPVPRDTVLMGKWIGGYLVLALPFVLAFLAGCMLLMIQPDISLRDTDWLRVCLLGVLSLLYLAAIFSVSLFVSCSSDKPATAIMILVTLWLIFVLAIPNLAPYLAQAISPTPNPQTLLVRKLTEGRKAMEAAEKEPMAAWNKANPVPQGGSSDYQSRRRIAQLGFETKGLLDRLSVLQRITAEHRRELDEQIRVGRWIGRLSPFACFAMSATRLTDMGMERQRRMHEQAAEYQEGLIEWATEEQIYLYEYMRDNNGEWMEDWTENRKRPIPRFEYKPSALGQDFRDMALDAGLLLGTTILFFLLSWVRFLRYDVR